MKLHLYLPYYRPTFNYLRDNLNHLYDLIGTIVAHKWCKYQHAQQIRLFLIVDSPLRPYFVKIQMLVNMVRVVLAYKHMQLLSSPENGQQPEKHRHFSCSFGPGRGDTCLETQYNLGISIGRSPTVDGQI